MITYNTSGVKMPKIKRRDTTAWIKAVIATYNKRLGEVGYMFVNDEKILEINNEYLQHDYYTDVITFDYNENDVLNGDIVISLDTVRTNAEKFGKTFDDELHRVIIHGILHLCGLHDKAPGEREQMEKAENRALALR
ncbi:rRNA maturation RNase YbeY [Hoylesella saccharolytica]|jgi:metalloprotein, YbeY family|uniref:rRNA maturation RNase YbeY n=1 Tax=Hoylesella saccharolytica TaxID=633701 RepID=UPI0028D7BBBE|nr:rRNA maturation RNase YbeY [Hoylesella saccharolytica]